MNCPKCCREMQEILSEGVPIEFCTGCRGSFLDKGEEPAFAGQPDAVRKALDKGLRDATETPFACPKCGGRMRRGWLLERGFVLDQCEGCGGLWFDSRELSRLKKLEPEPEPPPIPKPTRRGKERRGAAPARAAAAPDGSAVCPSCRRSPRASDMWQCRCGFQWHAIGTAGVCPRCRRRWEELQCLRCGAWSPPRKWLGRD